MERLIQPIFLNCLRVTAGCTPLRRKNLEVPTQCNFNYVSEFLPSMLFLFFARFPLKVKLSQWITLTRFMSRPKKPDRKKTKLESAAWLYVHASCAQSSNRPLKCIFFRLIVTWKLQSLEARYLPVLSCWYFDFWVLSLWLFFGKV